MIELQPTTVLQSTSQWLPQTQAWLYNQVRFLPSEVESHVVAEAAANLDQYRVPNLHILQHEAAGKYTVERGQRRLTGARQFAYWPRLALRYEARLVHSHFGPWGWRDAEWVTRDRLKHVVSFYGYDVAYLPRSQPAWQQRYRDMFRSADLVLCEGPFMARSIVSMGCPEEKVRVHRLGIDCDLIPFRPRVWEVGGPLKLLIAASFREKKGIPYAIEAIGRLGAEISLQLTLIGDSDHSPASAREKQHILAAVQRAGLADRVRLAGYVPYASLIREAYEHHIYLAPSVTAADGDCEGGAPVGMIEMAASGMPVVASRHCDIPQVIQHGVTGLLAGERDAAGLFEQLRWLVENRDEWSRLTTAARAHIEADFNARRQGRALAAIYGEVCAPRPALEAARS
jgi:colanic acid/amylovoran biosynthesis glycosyltransferase